ncbi:hypothetical protein BH11PLA2_BH11PLA2_23450 [soil metagenome]
MRPFPYFGIAIFLSGVMGCAPQTSVDQGPEAGPVLPGLLNLDGQPLDLGSLHQSPLTVFLFTRTDCPISNRCAPEICRLCEKYQPRGVRFYLVYVDAHQSPDEIRRHLHDYGYPCPGLRDVKHKLVTTCNATATPEAVVWNRERATVYQGRVNDLYMELGKPRAEATTHDLADAIDAALTSRPITTPLTRAIGCPIADLKD